MNSLQRDVIQGIGNTPLLALRNFVPENGSRLLLKLESSNPTGSMKDRMALAMIEAAEADGRLRAGGSVVEYTGGNVVSAQRLAEQLGSDATVVTVMCATGMKYLSSVLYREQKSPRPVA